MTENYEQKLNMFTDMVNEALEKYMPEKDDPTVKAMRYSLFAGGKRIRPVICLAFCELFGGDVKLALPFACAIEMIHTYSLIYDDMPCMDNDTMRRGKPSNHVVFGEDIALMAGVALFGEAIGVANSAGELGISNRQVINAIEILINASGLKGIISGQVLDMENRPGLSEAEVERIYKLKTAALLKAAALLGCAAADADPDAEKAAQTYAEDLGMAFQIRDDILDVIGSKNELGKTPGKDESSQKTTYVNLLGVEKAQQRVHMLTESAKSALPKDADTGFLCWLADKLCARVK